MKLRKFYFQNESHLNVKYKQINECEWNKCVNVNVFTGRLFLPVLLLSKLNRCDSVTMGESTNPRPMDPDAAVWIMSLTYVPLVYV